MDSLANNANTAVSATIDNTTALDLFMDIELVIATQGSARTAGAWVGVYLVQALDGSTFGDTHEVTAKLVALFPLDAATTARRATVHDIPIPPGLFRLFARNVTGQALAASGNTVKHRLHAIQSV